jgi:hypothetical protein
VGDFVARLVDRFNDLLDRFDEFRYRQRGGGLTAGHVTMGVILLGSILALGILVSRAALASDAPSYVRVAQALSSSSGPVSVSTDVVTETIKRNGRTVRVVRHRTSPGEVVVETIAGGGRTVRDTHTETSREVETVTVPQPVTVIETVTVLDTVTVTTTPGPPGP